MASEERVLFDILVKPKIYSVLACVTCESVVLFVADRHRHRERSTPGLFYPTICAGCDEEQAYGKIGIADFQNVSLSKNLILFWEPYLAMSAFVSNLGGSFNLELDEFEDKVLLQRRVEAGRSLSDYDVKSVKVNPRNGISAAVVPQLSPTFFLPGEY